MGQDKALLPFRGSTLVEHVAGVVQQALRLGGPTGLLSTPSSSFDKRGRQPYSEASQVAIIGDPAKYGGLSFPVYPDKLTGCGPLGGIYTALAISQSGWNLVVACDMPGLSVEILRALLEGAYESRNSCVIATGPRGELEPLCAVYHRRCLPAVTRAIREKRFKMKDFVVDLETLKIPIGTAALANVNTPAEWAEFGPIQK